MRLAHLHISKPISYQHSLRLQEALLEKHFRFNSYNLNASRPLTTTDDASDSRSGDTPVQPTPTLLTFQSQPVYTVGRRHLKANPLSQSQIDFLTTNDSEELNQSQNTDSKRLAAFHASPRGGLLTYHAPGQLTAYLIINLRTHGITPRCYIRMLENTVIRTCKRHGVSNTMTTTDPGVWIGEQDPSFVSSDDGKTNTTSCSGANLEGLRPTTRKICAIGVHVVRGITSHGIGLNVYDAPIASSDVSGQHALPTSGELRDPTTRRAPGYLSWGFERIVACGLEGKSVTWLQQEDATADTVPDTVAHSLALEVCHGLTTMGAKHISEVVSVDEEEVLSGSSRSIYKI